MRASRTVLCIRAAALVLPLAVACASTDNGNGGNGDDGGGGGSNGGASNGGASNSGGGSNGGGSNGGSSGSRGASSSGGGSGGSNGAGSSGSNGSSGAGGSSGASNSGGSSGTGSNSSSGSGGDGGSSSNPDGSVNVEGGTSMCGTPGPNVISDFETGSGSMIVQGGRSGWWYIYGDTVSGSSQTPAANANGPIAVAAAPSDDKTLAGETCNKYALHSTSTGHTQYAGVGATFIPGSGTNKSVYSLASFDGIQFDIKGTSGELPIYFEVLTQESQLTTYGGSITPAMPDPHGTITTNNNRGYFLSTAGSTPSSTSTAIPTTMTTVYVPFSMLIPRHFPQPGPNGCGSTTPCEAPVFVPGHALGFQFSVYPDVAFNNTSGNYDLWIDNVSLYTGDNGLNPSNPTAAAPTFNDGAAGFASCKSAIPTFAGSRTAQGKYLQAGYNNWKARFVSGSAGSARKVIRPENNNDTVSEGIGYGMLLAVYFNDQSLFDDLWKYEQANPATGLLMKWNNTGGTGSATDADEDMAFALIEAGKRWGGSYAGTASTMISQIATSDIDFTANLPKGGSNYGSVNPTNPSYFAPAYYRVFAGIDTNGSRWTSLADHVISVISALGGSNHGLVPAWCTTNCTTAGSNGASTDGIYQYDAHRVPWRVGIDYCWNGTAAASSYLSTISGFFAGLAGSGIDTLYDEYNLGGTACTTCSPAAQPNSMSLVGSAAVGAMASASNAAFVKSAWQFVLDGGNRATQDVSSSGQYAYSYFNATVGLLTALTLSGNFYPM